MKRLFTLLIVFLLCAISSWAQETIGNGTVNNNLPINPYYGYTYSQNIYLTSDINSSGPITTLSFYFAGTSLTNSNNWTIYMGHTAKSAFSSTTDWIPVSAMTQVYSGIFTSPTAPGWLLIDITDFTYDGTDNLVIAVDENTASYNGSGDYFYTTAATTNRAIRYYADGTNPDPAAPPTGTLVMAYPNVILGGITMTPCNLPNQPTALTVTPVAYSSAGLTGTFTPSSPAATGYLVVRYPNSAATTAPVNGTNYAAGNALGLGTVAYSGPLTTFTDIGLAPNTTYNYYIYPLRYLLMAQPILFRILLQPPRVVYGAARPPGSAVWFQPVKMLLLLPVQLLLPMPLSM